MSSASYQLALTSKGSYAARLAIILIGAAVLARLQPLVAEQAQPALLLVLAFWSGFSTLWFP